jgi:hypothetical protein
LGLGVELFLYDRFRRLVPRIDAALKQEGWIWESAGSEDEDS